MNYLISLATFALLSRQGLSSPVPAPETFGIEGPMNMGTQPFTGPTTGATLATVPKLAERETQTNTNAKIAITVFGQSECMGDSQLWTDVNYKDQNKFPQGFRSYKVSRELTGTEQLDFSTSITMANTKGCHGFDPDANSFNAGQKPDDPCARFTLSANVTKVVANRCMLVACNSQCVELWHY